MQIVGKRARRNKNGDKVRLERNQDVKDADAQGVCGKCGDELQLQTPNYSYGRWYCDGQSRGGCVSGQKNLPLGDKSYHCPKCSYDLCGPCYLKPVSKEFFFCGRFD